MSELHFRIHGLTQRQADTEQRRKQESRHSKFRLLQYTGTVAFFPVAVFVLIALEVYASRSSGAPAIGASATRHEIGRLREAGGRRVPGQAIRGRRTTGDAPNCDCNGVENGILDHGYRDDCLAKQQNLRELHATGKLGLVAEDGKLVGGNFCGPNYGPKAWPLAGGPINKPSGIPEGKPCHPSGMIQDCQ